MIEDQQEQKMVRYIWYSGSVAVIPPKTPEKKVYEVLQSLGTSEPGSIMNKISVVELGKDQLGFSIPLTPSGRGRSKIPPWKIIHELSDPVRKIYIGLGLLFDESAKSAFERSLQAP